jgi:L,D-transpeptidase catalytic domain
MFKQRLSVLIIPFVFIAIVSCSFLQDKIRSKVTQSKAKEALTFCRAKGLNTDWCVLVDMSIHSGLKRLYVYDFKLKKAVDSALVSHGCGQNPWGQDGSKTNPQFSNSDGSHLSALGKYKIGSRGWSNWGIHVNYKMHGLESSNSNAMGRLIVLHSWEAVVDEEVFPNGTPEGWGCPALSNEFMKLLDQKLQKAKQPVLFWIYN